jgi:hypothetical protein
MINNLLRRRVVWVLAAAFAALRHRVVVPVRPGIIRGGTTKR